MMVKKKKQEHKMRPSEMMVIVLCSNIFMIMLGRGLFDGLIDDWVNGLDIFTMLAKHATEASSALTALIIGGVVLANSIIGRKKRRG